MTENEKRELIVSIAKKAINVKAPAFLLENPKPAFQAMMIMEASYACGMARALDVRYDTATVNALAEARHWNEIHTGLIAGILKANDLLEDPEETMAYVAERCLAFVAEGGLDDVLGKEAEA